MIIVDQPGPLALLQDLGRPGLAYLGVSPSGAADRTAHTLANRLVGNPEGSTTIETVLGGLRVTSTEVAWVAVTGAPTEVTVSSATATNRPTASHSTIVLQPGDRLEVRPPEHGLRNYLAVRGGIKAARVLGSRSRDVLAGLGPAPLVAGQRLALGRPRGRLPDAELAPPNPPSRMLRLLPGPRRDWFTDAAWSALVQQSFTVSTDADRVAVRLQGPALERRITDELPSEGLVRGAIQVPPSGQPLIFGADHPVTGGYPVIAVVSARAADHAAQLRPGDQVRFRL